MYELKKIEFEKNFIKAQQDENKEELQNKLSDQEYLIESKIN